MAVIDDYADDRFGATALTLATAKAGTIDIVSDQDYFKVNLVAGQRYLFEMAASGAGSLDTAYLGLYSPTGGWIDSAADADLAQFSYIAASTGTYYLEATELSDDSIGTYTVKASASTVVDDYSDDRFEATALALATAKAGTIDIVSDQDYFKVNLVAGQRYLFEMAASGTGSLDTAYLGLYSPTGGWIDSAADADLAQFSYIAASTGTYYLEATELSDDSIGTYTVKASKAFLGTTGGETVGGTSGNDWLEGLAGNDILDGSSGADTMLGGADNDTYIVDNLGDKVYETTAVSGSTNAGGTDTVKSSVSYTLGSFVEKLVLTGSGSINGTGNSLANTLTGNLAANTLNGGTGADTLLGGAGNDTYIVDNLGDKVYETTTVGGTTNAGGIDTVRSSVSYTLGSFVENLMLTGSGTINGTGNSLANTITGNTGQNVLSGGPGNDTLSGGAGNDTLVGGSGTDTANYSTASSGVTVSLAVTTAQATGGSGSDTLISIERLTGSKYNDVLTGSAGNNKLNGGAGNDILSGGAGSDIFRFSNVLSASVNVDTIKDFASVDDSIELENAVFTKLSVVGALASAHFKANPTGMATDSNDYVVYETDTGKLFYDADGSGSGVSVLIATLTGAPMLTSSDIFVT